MCKLLHKQKVAYSDFTITEFEDPFLSEHVRSVSLCDTDITSHGKTVTYNVLSGNICILKLTTCVVSYFSNFKHFKNLIL